VKIFRLDVFIVNISFQGQHKKVIAVLIGQMILTYVISETCDYWICVLLEKLAVY